MVISGQVPDETPVLAPRFMDEWSTLGRNSVAEFYQDRAFSESVVDAADFSLQPAGLSDLKGGDRDQNAKITREILRGEDRGPRREAVLLNAGAALFVAGLTRSMTEGWDMAAETIDAGKAGAKLDELVAVSRK